MLQSVIKMLQIVIFKATQRVFSLRKMIQKSDLEIILT